MNAILRFSVENYKSIAERKSIVFTPTAIKDNPINNIAALADDTKYLKTCGIYGANSSGKSNLITAIARMKNMVRSSIKMNDDDKLPYSPFLLDETSNTSPTVFELEFFNDDKHYRYGFSYTEKKIHEEWLIEIHKKKEKTYFLRTIEGIGVNEELFPEGKDLEEKTNKNRLFLSLVGQLGGNLSNSLLSFFKEKLNVISGLETDNYDTFSRRLIFEKLPGYDEVKQFFINMQLGFLDMSVKAQEFNVSRIPADMPEKLKKTLIENLSGKKELKAYTKHGVYNNSGEQIGSRSFDLDEMESAGTQKLFEMSGPIFDTIVKGKVLVIDELDAKMHPLLSRELVSLFNGVESNPEGAQLVFSTHDTNLLSSGLLRRDQIWFTEKDTRERTDIYNMMQIVLPDGTKPRGDGNIERNYIQGRYGAIPYISYLF